MEDEVLTAVTQRKEALEATVAPVPYISNRLSIVDFQKLTSDTAGKLGTYCETLESKQNYFT